MSNPPNGTPKGLRNLLVVRTDRLGDVVLTLPLCAEARRLFPGVRVTFLARRYAEPLLAGNPLLDHLLWQDDERGRPRSTADLAEEVRRGAFDAAVVARPTPAVAWMLWRAGVPVRVGTGYRWFAPLFTHRVFEHRKTASRHELEYNLQLLRPLGVEVPDHLDAPVYGFRASEETRERMRRVLESFGIPNGATLLVVHPGSGGSARDWPVDRFRDLCQALVQDERTTVVVTGLPAEERTVRRVLQGAGPRIVSLSGRLTLEEMMGLLSIAHAFVSNSTGPLHVAAGLGTPVVGLYPPVTAMSARRWGPYSLAATVLEGKGPADCARCRRGTPCACMETIALEEVLTAVRSASGRPKGMESLR